MNAKLCKRLRRWAREMTPGEPAVDYTRRALPNKYRRLRLHVTVTESSTRGVYLRLKRAQRAAA